MIQAQIVPNAADIISATEAARILGVTQSGMWRILVNGKLPAQLLAGRYLLRRSDVLDLKRKRELTIVRSRNPGDVTSHLTLI